MLKALAIVIAALCFATYIFWRFFWFLRDPDRTIPDDQRSIVSPADGTIIYIKEVTSYEPPISLKNGRQIPLEKFLGDCSIAPEGVLIGIFMHPTSVHVNRAPISGIVRRIEHQSGSNLPMTLTWWRTNLGMRPFENYATHLLTNERNIVHIAGERLQAVVVQIADIYISKIECWLKENSPVQRGDRLGMIRFGSQVDLFVAKSDGLRVVAAVGQKVRGGSDVLMVVDGNWGARAR